MQSQGEENRGEGEDLSPIVFGMDSLKDFKSLLQSFPPLFYTAKQL